MTPLEITVEWWRKLYRGAPAGSDRAAHYSKKLGAAINELQKERGR